MGSQISCGLKLGDRAYFCAIDYEHRPTSSGTPGLVDRASCCGSDAFYRDAFTEGETEIAVGSKSLAALAREQAKLKTMKTKVFISTLTTQPPKDLRTSKRSSDFQRSLTNLSADGEGVIPTPNGNCASWDHSVLWLARTIPEYSGQGLQEPTIGPSWTKGNGVGIALRDVNYLQNKSSITSQGHMYQALALDALKSTVKIDQVMGSLVNTLPKPSKGSTWTCDCPLPRILCINVMLPLSNPKNFWSGDDAGCSFVCFFEITEETLEHLRSEKPPSWVRLFQKFCEGPAGHPGGPKSDPNRSLGLRRSGSNSKDRDTGILKAIGRCENEDDLGVPQWLRAFNGQCFVITESGYVVKDPGGEWIEMGFDVRQFPFLFKEALYKFSYFLPKGQYHVGFAVQATEDEFLPEGLICDLFASGICIKEVPVEI